MSSKAKAEPAGPQEPSAAEVLAVYREEADAQRVVEQLSDELARAKNRLQTAQGARLAMLRRTEKGAQ